MKKETIKHHLIKLDKIPKKDLFQAPERYFDELPMKIQNRLPSSSASQFDWASTLKWAPVLVIALALGIWWFSTSTPQQSAFNIEEQLASVTDEEIIDYLESAEVSTQEIVDALSYELLFNAEDPLENWIDYEPDSGEFDQIILENLSTEEYYN